MNKTHQEQWEEAANVNEDRYIASGWHYSDKLYETSGILTVGEFLRVLISHTERKELENKTLLELGCGNGRMTKYLAESFDKVIAVDCSKTMLEKGKEKVKAKNIEWSLTVDDSITVKDGTIDFFFTFIVLQHCKEDTIKKYFKEADRLLKSEGLFIFQLPITKQHKEPDEFNSVANWTLEEVTKELPNFEVLQTVDYALGYHVFKKK